ncbi:MAG: GNAT family N-acetyltransferase [Flavobacteriaceae bacterium]|nr:GNAT family N-acetyltransferase [Flavobacteriaceae bacterium]
MTVDTKNFQDLTPNELYSLLQLRSEVFVVEQNCVYQDIDGKDRKALHVLGLEDDKIIAYTRIFKPGDYFTEASIGRVVVKKSLRGKGLAYKIMNASIDAVKEHFQETIIRVSAQTYLRDFYNNLKFKQVGEEYMEDGIPHIAMVRN